MTDYQAKFEQSHYKFEFLTAIRFPDNKVLKLSKKIKYLNN